MEDFFNFYQNLPFLFSPTIFKVGFFGVSWYAMMYVVAFGVVYGLLSYRLKKGEMEKLDILDFMFYAILGVLIGGRLGYAIFYDPIYYLDHPLEIVSPYDFEKGTWVGIYGMSYHGGFLGALWSAWYFCRKNSINLGKFADFVIPAIPAGYFFGRIGNFLNGELYGRLTDSFLGMRFFDGQDILLRHPSQLYEAFFEGLVMFILLWSVRNRKILAGKLLFIYLVVYGAFRFGIEFVREPDPQIGLLGGFFTLGQVLCFLMILVGVWGIVFKNKSKTAIILK